MSVLSETVPLLRDSPLPLYYQIKQRLLSSLTAGEWPAGERAPSETELAARFGVGRPTVRQALAELEREGWLERRRGSGTYVRDRHAALPFAHLAGTTAMFRAQGRRVRTRVLERAVLPGGHEPLWGGSTLLLRRVRLVEERPAVYEENRLPLSLLPGLEREPLEDRSLFEVVEGRFHVPVHAVEQQFAAVGAPERVAAALEIAAGAPVLWVARQSRLREGTVVEASEVWFASELCRFEQRLTRDGVIG
jgi:GntR family transcriptional regulator